MIFKINCPEETEALGSRLAEALSSRKIRRAYIALDGEMGVGKTVFTRGFAAALGISGVKSPTYTVVNEHRSRSGVSLYHFDLYRISDADDLWSIGYDDYIESEGYSIVEWSERAGDDIPDGAIRVCISRGEGEDERIIEISGIDLGEGEE